MSTQSNFKVGDKVKSPKSERRGVVEFINLNTYPDSRLGVRWYNGGVGSYTLDGRLFEDDPIIVILITPLEQLL